MEQIMVVDEGEDEDVAVEEEAADDLINHPVVLLISFSQASQCIVIDLFDDCFIMFFIQIDSTFICLFSSFRW